MPANNQSKFCTVPVNYDNVSSLNSSTVEIFTIGLTSVVARNNPGKNANIKSILEKERSLCFNCDKFKARFNELAGMPD